MALRDRIQYFYYLMNEYSRRCLAFIPSTKTSCAFNYVPGIALDAGNTAENLTDKNY